MILSTRHDVPVISGLRYVPGYLDASAQQDLLAHIDSEPWRDVGSRRAQVYGYSYHHTKGGVYRIGELPPWVLTVAKGLEGAGVTPFLADQLIANEYQPGQGIFPHVDAPCFTDTIVSVSLGSTCVMEFTSHASERIDELLLEPGSVLVMSGEAREGWKHAIPARHADVWNGEERPRGRRVSLTFRKMLDEFASR